MWWQRSYEWCGLWVQVCERLGPSLYDFLRKNNYRPFPVDLVRDFGRQLLESVACRCYIYTNCLSSSCSLQFSDPSQAVCLDVEDNSWLAWYFGFFWILEFLSAFYYWHRWLKFLICSIWGWGGVVFWWQTCMNLHLFTLTWNLKIYSWFLLSMSKYQITR